MKMIDVDISHISYIQNIKPIIIKPLVISTNVLPIIKLQTSRIKTIPFDSELHSQR